MCVCVKTRIFLVKKTVRKREVNLHVCGMCESLNLLVIQVHCWHVDAFVCIWLFHPCVSSVAACMSPWCAASLWTKKFWVLILFEWIEMICSKFTLVNFILGQPKFKCMYVCMSKHNLWPDLTYENRRNYLFFEVPIL